ncbi:MAG: LexA family transcriptional regulator [Paracoccus sp. (in: a-proteobacteria)]|uniref:XRE family transcriptional regulator n=1 Tax=Paracoccus sp. TaxID=267 RepID=UPI0026E041B0|nr:LexA family transcriptional regulator [Paracoccus sp. (in: a-proteobacteria)]MDO5631104.1 LexA family transcriptional regulator [Paracoccus sp. (in: a-proteobacteria)]
MTYILTGQRSSLPPSSDVDPAIGQRLAEWRRGRGLPIGDLASRIGASIDYIEEVENGTRAPKPALLSALARLGLDPDWLMTGAYPALPPVEIDGSAFSQVQMYEAQLAAGAGALNSSEEVIGNLAFRTDWLRREGVTPGAASLVRVRGDSMEPTLRDGALVLVDHKNRDAARKGIYALRIGDDVLVKRLQQQGDVLLINSDNPAYDSRVLSGHNAEQVEIIGRVAWAGYTFRQ